MRGARVGMLGCGVVGSAVARRLGERAEPGAPEIVSVAVRDLAKRRDCDLSGIDMLGDPKAVVDDPRVDVVVEVMGGTAPARDLIEHALACGKPVVTANKEVLGNHGPELRGLVADTGTPLRFEAAVAAGLPVLRALAAARVGGRVRRVEGVLNGTATFVLSEMEQRGCELAEAVALAQERGYAEADPSRDLDGTDAADKLAVLAQLLFGEDLRTPKVSRIGIEGLGPADVAQARAEGRVWRLVATAVAGACARVEPVKVADDHPFARLSGVGNAVRAECEHAGWLTFEGPGAGGDATAAAVVGDLAAVTGGVGLEAG